MVARKSKSQVCELQCEILMVTNFMLFYFNIALNILQATLALIWISLPKKAHLQRLSITCEL